MNMLDDERLYNRKSDEDNRENSALCCQKKKSSGNTWVRIKDKPWGGSIPREDYAEVNANRAKTTSVYAVWTVWVGPRATEVTVLVANNQKI